MYEILVTRPLRASECVGECRLSANLCKRALDVTADVILEATRNADILTINEGSRGKTMNVKFSIMFRKLLLRHGHAIYFPYRRNI